MTSLPVASRMLVRTLLGLGWLSSLAAAQVHFSDVTSAAGIDYLQSIPGNPVNHSILAMTGGAAAADFDSDGWVDLLVTRILRPPIMYRNLGQSSTGVHLGFADVTAQTFSPAFRNTRTNGASFGDVDGDGDLDLLLTGIFSAQHFLWINDGSGHFTEEGLNRGLVLGGSPAHKGFSSSFGDFDRDGYLDLYVTEWGHVITPGSPTPSNSRLLRNRGATSPGYFDDVTVAAGVGLEDSVANGPLGSWHGVYSFTPKFADFNNDLWPDLAIAGDFTTSRLFWNNGDGTFSDGTASAGVGRDENGMGAAVGDFNRDGNLDWFISAISDPFDSCGGGACNWGLSGNRLYLGDGNGSFTDATDSGVRDGGWGWGATALDYDNDGLLDLALTNGIAFTDSGPDGPFHHDASKLWRNTGSGFSDVGVSVGIWDRRSGKALLKLDFDRDGDEDLFIVNAGSRPVLYRNDGGSAAQWLQVELSGSGPNTSGIGARALLWPNLGDAPLVCEQSASSNFLGQNELLLQFGLGGDALVARLEVRWPSGTTTVLTDIPAQQRITVQEP